MDFKRFWVGFWLALCYNYFQTSVSSRDSGICP